MKKYVIALDEGTTSCRAIVFDKNLTPLYTAQQEFPQIFPKPGYVEHNPMDIYNVQMLVLHKAILDGNIAPDEIASIGITNQRETTILWDRATGEPIYNAIVWQCRRTSELCDELKAKGYEPIIKQKTGLIIDAYFSATKIKWIFDNVEGVKERAERGEICFGTVDSWLLYKMTGQHKTDYTNASRTMLFNINTLSWDREILELLDIPESILPTVVSSSEIYGYYNYGGVNIPVTSMVGDQQGALFGQRCFEKGQAKNTYGTGCFLLMNSGGEVPEYEDRLLTSIGIGLKGRINYCIEGSVFIGGAVIKWLRDELGIIKSASETEDLSLSVADNGGVYFVPAFTGLGAPYWDMYAKGSIQGLTRGSNKAHIVRAAVESMAYQTDDLIKAIESAAKSKITELKVDGGACANNFLMQFQSDISGICIFRPKNRETTALGAAMLAGMAVDFYPDFTKEEFVPNIDRVFTPQMLAEERGNLLDGWHKAVEKTLSEQ